MLEVQPDDHRQLQDVADLLAKSKKVIVVTGAGISTNCGIPDFRSEDGLYSLIQSYYDTTASNLQAETGTDVEEPIASPHSHLNAASRGPSKKLPSQMKGQDLFDARIWNDPISTSVFYTFMASLRKKIKEDVSRTTLTHKFIRTLREGGRLVRCYTQNIDGLEERDGLCTELSRGKGSRTRFSRKALAKPRPEGPIVLGSDFDGGCEVVQLHGDLKHLRCSLCHKLTSWGNDELETTMLAGEAPGCQSCLSKAEDRRSQGRRGTAVGTLRPNVVLYGEEHPCAQELSTVVTHDLRLSPDILLIMGTSLRVHGIKTMVKEFAKAVHASGRGRGKVIFVNRSKPSESIWSSVIDYWLEMDCDAWVGDLRERRSDLWERQGMLKLAIEKETTTRQRAKQSRPTKKKVAIPEVDVESDKENIVITPRKPTTVQDKARVAARSKTAVEKAQSSESQHRDNIIPPITPSRSAKKHKASLLNTEQLPTPPASGRSRPSLIGSTKRGSQTFFEEGISCETPSKRKKLVKVWVDPQDELE